MNNEKLRIVMIGCGRFAGNFVSLFKNHPVTEKVYVCDLKKDRERDYMERYGVEGYESFEKALEDKNINAVAIFTPREKHGPMVIAALKAGKHVYSAVPCAVSVDEIIEIEKLVRETRLIYSMGETGFYRAPAIYCREEFKKGTFGKFVYAEAQYNHDIRNMEGSFRSSGGEDWKRFAGVPPFFYPTHSTSMILSALPGVYVKKVSAVGYAESPRTDIYGRDGQNNYDNPFACETMLMQLSNGGVARVSENRCVGWMSPETYITQFYGSEGGYEFSVAHHHQAVWDPARPGKVIMKDVSQQLQPESIYNLMKTNYDEAIQKIADSGGFSEESPIQPTERLPRKEFEGIPNKHNGTHHFLIDDFCRAFETGKLSPTNIWAVARYNLPGLVAHQSAMQGGVLLDVPDLGDPPADWEVLDYRTMQ